MMSGWWAETFPGSVHFSWFKNCLLYLSHGQCPAEALSPNEVLKFSLGRRRRLCGDLRAPSSGWVATRKVGRDFASGADVTGHGGMVQIEKREI